MSTINLDYAYALSTPLQGVIYGFSLCLFGATIFTLLRRCGPYDKVNYVMITMSCSLFILSTIHMGIDISRLITGLVNHRDFPGGPIEYFGALGSSSWFYRTLVYGIQTALGDAIVIYRCYVVWSRSLWVISIPVFLWLATIGTGGLDLWACSQFAGSEQGGQMGPSWVNQISNAYFATTLAVYALSTGLLAYRLWTVDRELSMYHTTNRHLSHIARVVIDSGALYSAFLVVVLILYIVRSNGKSIALDLASPIISVCFYMVIVRLRYRTLMVYGKGAVRDPNAAARRNHDNTATVHIDSLQGHSSTGIIEIKGPHVEE